MYVYSLSHFTLFGGIQAIFGQKRDGMKPEIAPILSSWATKWAQNGQKTAPNGPKWSQMVPNGPQRPPPVQYGYTMSRYTWFRAIQALFDSKKDEK